MEIILPKTPFEKSHASGYPVFFLAGPIKGGENWQEKCCLQLREQMWKNGMKKFYVFVPCRWTKDNCNIWYDYCLSAQDKHKFPRQTEWEHHCLNLTAELSKEHRGCIIFWLPEESKKNPRNDGQPYARDTYGELGRWGKNAALTGAHIVIGAEFNFPGLSQIQENLRLDFNRLRGEPGSPICRTLKETVAKAVEWVKI